MPVAYYIIPIVDPPWSRENPQRPQYVDTIQCNWTGHPVEALGVYVCKVNTTLAKHQALANSGGVFVPKSDYSWDTVISTMFPADRNFLSNLCTGTLGIAFDASETIGELFQRIINAGLWDLGAIANDTQFQNLPPGQQQKILSLYQKWNMTPPAPTETVKSMSKRGGDKWWDAPNLNVEEF